MIPVPEDASDRDASRWLSQVFMWERDGVRIPYLLQGVENGSVLGTRVLGGGSQIETLAVRNCFAHWPTLGCVNLEDKRRAVYLQRRTVREYQRSLNSHMLKAKRLDLMGGGNPLNSANLLSAAYQHSRYYSPEEAMSMINSGTWTSVAISRTVALGRSLCTYKPALFVRGEYAGSVQEGRVTAHTPEHAKLATKIFGAGYDVNEG